MLDGEIRVRPRRIGRIMNRPADHWCTDARRSVRTSAWPGGVAVELIRAALILLPGAPVSSRARIAAYVSTVMRLRRPDGYRSAVKLALHAGRRAEVAHG